MLGNNVVVGVNVFPRPSKVNAFALRFAFRLYDEDFVLYFLLFFKIRLRFFLFLGRWTYWFRLRLFNLLCLWRLITFILNFQFFLGFFLWHWNRLWLHWDNFPKLAFKEVHFVRQDIGGRKKVVIFWKLFEHQHQVLSQLVFMSNDSNSWPLRHSLMWPYLVELIGCNLEIEPANVKLLDLSCLRLLAEPWGLVLPGVRVWLETRINLSLLKS